MLFRSGMTPWEGAQVAALEVLTTICYQKREEIQATSMRLFPAVALSDLVLYHHQARLMESIPVGAGFGGIGICSSFDGRARVTA